MKKLLYLVALVAAVTFTACGNKGENKECEGEKKECCEKAGEEKHECCKAKAAEQIVCDFEAAVAAGEYEKALQIADKADKEFAEEDFSEEQKTRIMTAAMQIPQEVLQNFVREE